jgi:hypothetical protein
MRYVLGILLLASPATAGEPVTSGGSQPVTKSRVQLFINGKEIGTWSYESKPDAPTTMQMRPLAQRPAFVVPRSAMPLRMRGPLTYRATNVLAQTMAEATLQMFEAIPGAIADAFLKGRFEPAK